MYLVVRSIDFAVKSVAIDVTRAMDHDRFAHFTQFLEHCADRGLRTIDIRYPANLPTSLFLMLRDFQQNESRLRLTLSPQGGDRSDEAPESHGFTCAGRVVEPGKFVEYRLGSRSLPDALDDLSLALLVVGSSFPLDETTISYLRLCLYELCANSVEHGQFGDRDPEIRVKLLVREERVEAEYRDNAGAFSTLRAGPLDIAERFKRRSKRGLGLVLLNRLTDRLAYARDDAWNCTTFTIGRRERIPSDLTRRMKMNDLSITTARTDAPDAVVLKISGSINSSTVPQLDAAFNEQFAAGRYTVVLDLSATEFISSSGVGLLIGTASLLRDKNGDLVLMNLPKLVNDIFEVLNIKMHFRIIGNLSELKAGVKA